MASPRANVISYDVFLSFRGEDTRYNFTDHLYEALNRAGIGTFRDNEEIKEGKKLKPEIETAIMESRASVVVLSKNYATSTWCLDELWLILEQRRKCNHFVLPIFYLVSPGDIKNYKGSFSIKVKSNTKWTDDNVNRWKGSLSEVAHTRGVVLSCDTPETEVITQIVNIVYDTLDRKEIHLPSNLMGMETRYKEINSWLEQYDEEFLAICGMGGSGKTTLARYIVHSNWKKFENISIIDDITSRCKEPHDFLQLQEKLLRDIVGGKKRKIPSVSQGTFKIEEVLQTKKALILLDDITERSQLIVLFGNGYINKESKIIITTRENNPAKWFESISWRCREYKMRLLDNKESLELLCLHALKSKIPMEGFKELAEHAVRYCEGNPLALELLGSSLSESNTISYWESQLNLLEKDIDSRIQDVLIRSYNSLSYNDHKELFLHIACFFVGKDVDYVIKILRHDYSTVSGIKNLTNRCLIYVSKNKKLMMHRLLQEMGRNIVLQESPRDPAKRSRVCLNSDSYRILRNGEGSRTIEGLALDIKMLEKDRYKLKTDSLKEMHNLKLLDFNFVKLAGSFKNVSENLRWLCWLGFHLTAVPIDLYVQNLVAIDMSYSKLEVFDPPEVLHSLEFLNLKDSPNLTKIGSINRMPNLENLILWNCHSLVHVCETINSLQSLALLNMMGCENLSKMKITDSYVTFNLPRSLQQLFLNNCNLECGESFRLSFRIHPFLQYLNLAGSLFKYLPSYGHLNNLRVLDLSFCSSLKKLEDLPIALAELYIYYCTSLEKVTFKSHRFTLQEFGYEGCRNLFEIEGFIKLVPITKLDETDLGHMKWLKEYQDLKVLLVGDDELTKDRCLKLKMLYEFDIVSTSLPDIKDPNMMTEYLSETPSFSFDLPLSPENKRLKGLNVTFRYTVSSDECVWFAKISTTKGVDLMYNPRVFGKPETNKHGIWLSYWPIGNTLNSGDKINVTIAVMNGLVIHECGASLVYSDEEVENETFQNNMEQAEKLGGDLSAFQLKTGEYYLCRRDLFELMELGRLTPGWLRMLIGNSLDDTDVRGWRKTGRPKQLSSSFTELKTVRCIIHGPESDQIYKIMTKMSKVSFVNRTMELTSRILKQTMRLTSFLPFGAKKRILLTIEFPGQMNVQMMKLKVLGKITALLGVTAVDSFPLYERRLTIEVHGTMDPVTLCSEIRKHAYVELIDVRLPEEESYSTSGWTGN